MCILFTGENLRALRFKSSQAFLKRPLMVTSLESCYGMIRCNTMLPTVQQLRKDNFCLACFIFDGTYLSLDIEWYLKYGEQFN